MGNQACCQTCEGHGELAVPAGRLVAQQAQQKSCHPLRAAPPPDEENLLVVTLEKEDPSDVFGFVNVQLETHPPKLEIKMIAPHGLLARYNETALGENVVEPGDCIVAVNGVDVGILAMRSVLTECQRVELLVEKQGVGVVTPKAVA
mmetsp:Transcript_130702/g.297671  ORF Transcript_130702/g.297671 Transcript_130702/m.297671 type:complete len:147 (-) Transcript_130702:55-495(-)